MTTLNQKNIIEDNANIYPLHMGSTELILHSNNETDSDDCCSSCGSEKSDRSKKINLKDLGAINNENGIVNPNNAVINVDNSSDVIIGPVTQIHGTVTIYQNVNNRQSIENSTENNPALIKSDSSASDVPISKTFKFFPFNNKYLKYLGIGIVLLLLGLIIIIPLIIIYTQNDLPSPPENSNHNKGNTTGSSTVPLGEHLLIYRDVWGGRPAKNFTRPLKHPTQYVIISHTVTDPCYTISDCSARVQSIQAYHVGTLGSPDVGYNFLIGGDANVYVGRGWDIVNFHMDNSIGICFIGNFVYDTLSQDQVITVTNLLQKGLDDKKLATNYQLLAHNQTFRTASPGANIYGVIKHWPHFNSNYLSYK